MSAWAAGILRSGPYADVGPRQPVCLPRVPVVAHSSLIVGNLPTATKQLHMPSRESNGMKLKGHGAAVGVQRRWDLAPKPPLIRKTAVQNDRELRAPRENKSWNRLFLAPGNSTL